MSRNAMHDVIKEKVLPGEADRALDVFTDAAMKMEQRGFTADEIVDVLTGLRDAARSGQKQGVKTKPKA